MFSALSGTQNDSRRLQNDTSKHSVQFDLDDPGPRMSLRFEADAKDVYHDVDFDTRPRPQVRDGVYYDEDDDVSSTDSADVIAQAKYRLKNLDKEAHVRIVGLMYQCIII